MWLLLLQRSILGNAPCPLMEAVGLSAVWANLANTLLDVILRIVWVTVYLMTENGYAGDVFQALLTPAKG